jgi:hypothetical protein
VATLLTTCLVAAGCDPDDGTDEASTVATDGPVTAKATARGLTAALLGHLTARDVASYGGNLYVEETHSYRSLQTMVHLEGDVDTVHVFVQDAPFLSDLGCEPDTGYVELECTTTSGGAVVSLMQRVKDQGSSPLLEGRTMRSDGAAVLVQLWASESTEDARALVVELLRDPAVGLLTTAGLNAAGEELQDYEELESEISLSRLDPTAEE